MVAAAILRPAGFFATLGILCAAVGLTAPRLEHSPPIYLPRAEYLRPMSLGYNNVLANLLWFRTISYFGEHYRSDRTYPWLAYMCDLVTDLDPRAEHVYRFAGVILPWEAGQADEGIRLLEKGVRVFPNSWLLQYWVGFTHYFFKNDFESAASAMRRAAQLPGAHPNTARLAAVLSAQQSGSETTLRFLAELKDEVDSDEMRAVVDQHMREAQLAMDLDRLTVAVAAYRERFGYPPSSLSNVVDVQLLDRVPNDPFGGVYLIDPESGSVTSSTGHTPSRLHQSKVRERVLRGKRADSEG